LFAVFDSMPPETVALLITLAEAFAATFTVTVIGSTLEPANSTSPRVHSSGESVQFQFVPEMAVAVRPAGRLSSTVTSAEVSAPPALATMIVYVFPLDGAQKAAGMRKGDRQVGNQHADGCCRRAAGAAFH
jgi:hypothetical protein